MFILAILTIIFARKHLVSALAILILGFCYMAYNVHQHLNLQFPAELENTQISITGTISSVVERDGSGKSRFIFKISSPTGIGKKVQLNWYNAPVDLVPGDRWRLTVKLKRPRAYANPGSFDLEKYLFAERISATGSVKKSENNILGRVWSIHKVRQDIFDQIKSESPYSGIVAALLLGIKHEMTTPQKIILQNTGTAHLMAISGLHIGLVATMVFFVMKIAYLFVPRRMLAVPSPVFSAWAALIASTIYALLAGFSIATQRALVMVIIMLSGILLRREVSRMHCYCLALFAVLLWDPFAILTAGFWLSFWAVGCLMYAFAGGEKLTAPWRWLKPQLVIVFGLLPLSLLFFKQSSLIAPIANFVAIPWVGFTVVPFCLLGLPGVAEQSLSLLWPLLEWLNNVPVYNWSVPNDFIALRLGCAVIGFFWMFMPKGIPGRYWGILCFIPLFIAQTIQVPYGQADFTLLDVGQGLAAVVRTQNHTLVYDTGNPGLGKMVIAPFLQTVGVSQIDKVMISHNDRDHIGGLKSLLEVMPVRETMLGECFAGQKWHWDGVDFEVLHPDQNAYYKKINDQSCVLLVKAGQHRLLLTGDIEVKSEQAMIQRYGNALQADVLLVPHHGSRTSSSAAFIDQVSPQLALIPAGYKNQYGHPKEQILERYWEREIPIYRTAQDGAIRIRLGKDLQPKCHRRQSNQGFWRND